MPIYQPKKHSSRRPSANKPSDYESLTLSIRALSDEGRGIASDASGRTIFVEGALPGEEVIATVMKNSRQYAQAKVKEIISPSPERLDPACPIFKQCGGCSLQYMKPEQQVFYKQESVLSQLSRWAQLEPKNLLSPIVKDHYGYRQRLRLGVDYHRNGDIYLGFREATSRRLVNVQECAVAEPKLQALILPIRHWLGGIRPKVVSHVELIHTSAGIGVVVRHIRPLDPQARQHLYQHLQKSELIVDVWFQGDKGAQLEDKTGAKVDPRLHYALDDFSLSLFFHPQDFIQSNHYVNQAMVNQAIELMAPKADEYMVDLFCGIGNFSLPLAQYAHSVIGIEGMDDMVQRARHNAAVNKVSNVGFKTADLSAESLKIAALANQFGDNMADGLLLDPPRSGARKICEQIMKLAPKRVVYVSCDSATFARDAQLLNEKGYQLNSLGVIDMFPHTSHIEVMALFIL